MEWDASFRNRADCSGRAVAGVHNQAYGEQFQTVGETKGATNTEDKKEEGAGEEEKEGAGDGKRQKKA